MISIACREFSGYAGWLALHIRLQMPAVGDLVYK
jgi:hypothetical protein